MEQFCNIIPVAMFYGYLVVRIIINADAIIKMGQKTWGYVSYLNLNVMLKWVNVQLFKLVSLFKNMLFSEL